MFDSLFNKDLIDATMRDPQALGQVVGSIIGVAGLFVGTFITIFTSFIIRNMDIKREQRREETEQARARKEKEFSLKQEIYSQFISELATLENIITKKSAGKSSLTTFENFDNEWTRTEIKVDLISDEHLQQLKNNLSQELMSLAKQRFSAKEGAKEIVLGEEYHKDRTALLEAIRQDMEINQK